MSVAGRLAVILTCDAKPLLNGLNAAMSALGKLSSAAFKVTAIGGTIGGVLGGIGAGFGAFSAISTAADFESTQVAFESLAGGIEKSRKLLEDLTDFAATTPFEFKDLTTATQRLMTYGFSAEESFGLIQRLGDLAAASPDGMTEGLNRVSLAIGQIRTKGKTATQELNQLAEAGVPAREALAKMIAGGDVGKAMDMVEKGQVSARQGIEAVLSIVQDPKIAGMMERQSRTVNGLFSTLKDSITIMMRDVGDELIKAFDVKAVLRNMTSFVSSIKVLLISLAPTLQSIGEYFTSFLDVDNIEAFTRAVFDVIGRIIKKIAEAGQSIAKVFISLGEFVKTYVDKDMGKNIESSARSFDKFMKDLQFTGQDIQDADFLTQFFENWREGFHDAQAQAKGAINTTAKNLEKLQLDLPELQAPAIDKAPALAALIAGSEGAALSLRVNQMGDTNSVPAKIDQLREELRRGNAQNAGLLRDVVLALNPLDNLQVAQ